MVALATQGLVSAWLEAALRSPHWNERLAVALSPVADTAALARLAEDGNWLVRAAARER
ncbi:MAG: hypothetical protein WCI67_10105 [Chloroflexales bacterium]